MAAHLRKRGSTFYLIDGEVRRSLKTDKKTLAEARLRQYLRQEFRFGPKITVKGYYEKWIASKKPPLVRQSWIQSTKQHFNSYVFPGISGLQISRLSVTSLENLRESLLRIGLSLKTVKNCLDGSLRAMWRDAMVEGIVEHNPFALLQWPRAARLRPDPFT